MVNIELKNFEKINEGWNISFKVNLTDDEYSRCDFKSLEYVGDYEIKKNDKEILFECNFHSGELNEKETIEYRLELIKKDIKSIINTCLKEN